MFEGLKNDLFLRALARQPTERTPCWLMRQAGRYLPEYRATRASAGTFTEMIRQPELTAELVMQPLRRYELDAAIVFSDILTIPDAMGLGLWFEEGVGPQFERPLRADGAGVEGLRKPDVGKDLDYVLAAVRESRRALAGSVPLIGFAGSPWTIFVYMVAAGAGHDADAVVPLQGEDRALAAKDFVARHPQAAQSVLRLLADAVGDLLLAQCEAGAQALMLFDSWGGVLGPHFERWSGAYLTDICARLKGCGAPVILYVRGAGDRLPQLADTGCDCLGVDQHCDLTAARLAVGDRVAVQGNLAPELLTSTAAEVRAGVEAVLRAWGKGQPGHIFNLGQGITPAADPELVAVMVDGVREYSQLGRAGG